MVRPERLGEAEGEIRLVREDLDITVGSSMKLSGNE